MRDPKLVRQYRELDVALASFQDKLGGSRRGEASLFIPTKANQRLMQSELDALLARQQILQAPDEVFSIVKDHMADFLDALQLSLNDAFSAPSSRVTSFGRIYSGIRNDARPAAQRKAFMISRFGQIAAFFAAVEDMFPEIETAELGALHSRTLTACSVMQIDKPTIPTTYQDLCECELADLLAQMESFETETIANWLSKLEAEIATRGEMPKEAVRSESDTALIDREVYRKALDAHGVDLDYMLTWYEADVEKTRA
ncbi:MAG: hypothetical protein FWE76_06610, partial [Symbiobacteriaceae bacterium]|nr:hypothetical protein [Symbiobacteriaceae bacterium]